MVRYTAVKAGLAFALYFLLVGNANATHLCRLKQGEADLLSILGPGPAIRAEWTQSPALGCVLTPESDLPAGNGRFADFAHGQIVFSPAQQMVVAAYEDNAGKLVVHWLVTQTFTYEFFLVRAQQVDGKEFGDPSENTSQQTVSGRNGGREGEFSYGPSGGIYSISVEGCDNDRFLGVRTGGSTCNQSWSQPAVVDAGSVDVTHKADGTTELTSASSAAGTAATFDERVRIGVQKGCMRSLDGKLNEEFPNVALAKLAMLTRPGLGNCASTLQEVNTALFNAKADTEVGSDVAFLEAALPGLIPGAVGGCAAGAAATSILGPFGTLVGCIAGAVGIGGPAGIVCGAASSQTGNYDMALLGLIPLTYEFGGDLAGEVRLKLLNELLNQTGGVNKVREKFHICGLTVDETENHILAAESSRYLTNQLLLEEVGKTHQPGSFESEQARKLYDNEENGLDIWMLNYLQKLLKRDFHEYNSRPYQRISVIAIHNLANYATNSDVKTGGAVKEEARMVLDYLAAKFAVGSMGLRRSAPFRRRFERTDFSLLYSNYSDEETWRFMVMAGDTRELTEIHHGRADWASWGTMVHAGLGEYRIPDLILEAVIDKANPFFQVIRHEGVELYASTASFLISAGGNYEPGLPVDEILGIAGQDTNAGALPTVLMPRSFGMSRNEMIRISGSKDHEHSSNTCVAPGFACGLNINIPEHYLLNSRCFRTIGNWTFVNAMSCRPPDNRGFAVAVFRAPCSASDCGDLDESSNYGFFEAVEALSVNPRPVNFDIDFDTFVNKTIENNGMSPQFTANGVNTYTTFDGRQLKFTPDHDVKEWGISDGAGVNIPIDEEAWRLAKGDIIDADGTGCVIIKNPRTGQALILDARTPGGSDVPVPKRREQPLTDKLSCDSIP